MSQKLKWLLIILVPLCFSLTCYATETPNEQLFSKLPPKGSLIDSNFWFNFMHTSQLKTGQTYLYKGFCMITDSKNKLLTKADSNLSFKVNQDGILTTENSTEFNCLNSSAAEINIFMSSIELITTLRQNCETTPPDYLNTTDNFTFLGISELNLYNTKQKAVIIFIETGQRRLPVQYAKRIVGRRVYGGQSTHLPLKLNTSGVIPPIFASSILMFPLTIANFMPKPWLEAHPWVQSVLNSLGPGALLYNLLYVGFIIFFCYFYTAVTFNPNDVADNMKKFGGYIPGIRPGQKTAEYIDKVLTRITLGGAIYVSAICVLPTILYQKFNVSFYFGGTSLLIVVGVALDTVQQIEAHMLSRHYEGLMKKGRLKGRRG